jgi:hypothetical protein
MTGFDLVRPLGARADSGRGSRLRAALVPALGVALPMESFGGIILGAALSLPVSAEIPVGARARLVPFVQPGVGVGAVLSGGGGYGVAPLLGGGVVLTGLGGGFGVSVGAQRVIVTRAETQLGAALTWRPDGGSR